MQDIGVAITEVRKMEEGERHKEDGDRAASVTVPTKFVELSGMWDLLPNGGAKDPGSPYGDYTPRALQGALSGQPDIHLRVLAAWGLFAFRLQQ